MTKPYLISRRSFLLGLTSICLMPLGINEAGAAASFEPFSFAFVSDIHLANDLPDTYKLVHESQLFLQELVKQLNQHKLDFVVFGGDQVEGQGHDQSNWQLFLDIMQTLQTPWSFILGEADIAGKTRVDKMKLFGPDWRGRGIESENPWWSLNPLPGVHIIGLDTSVENSATGYLMPDQLTWLKKDLKANKKLFSIIFSHHPLLPPPPFDGGPPFDEYVVTNGATAREIIGGAANARLVVSGHVNISKIQQERDVYHVSCPSLIVYPCAYRVFHVTPEAITCETYQIPFQALVKKAKKALVSYNLAYKYNSRDPESFVDLAEGEDIDRNARMPLAAGQPIEELPEPEMKKEKKVKKKKEKKAKPKKEKKQKKAKKAKVEEQPKEPAPEKTEEKQ